jgi:hypothetical protein
MRQWEMEKKLTDKPHYNIVFATPGKLIHGTYVKCLVETTKWLNEKGMTYKFLNYASSLVSQARETTAIDGEKSDWSTTEIGSGKFTYDRIVWIDSDISWSLEAFEKLISSEHEIISGMYYTQIHTMSVSVARFTDDGLRNPTNCKELDFFLIDEPIEVFGVGFGFISMKSGVFERMQRPWFRIERIDHPEFKVTLDIGEDYSWCMNARRAGMKIMLDSSIKVDHHKESTWHLK